MNDKRASGLEIETADVKGKVLRTSLEREEKTER